MHLRASLIRLAHLLVQRPVLQFCHQLGCTIRSLPPNENAHLQLDHLRVHHRTRLSLDLQDHLGILKCPSFSATTHVLIVHFVVVCEKVTGKDMYAQLVSTCRELELIQQVEQCQFHRPRHQLHTTPVVDPTMRTWTTLMLVTFQLHAHHVHGAIGRTPTGVTMSDLARLWHNQSRLPTTQWPFQTLLLQAPMTGDKIGQEIATNDVWSHTLDRVHPVAAPHQQPIRLNAVGCGLLTTGVVKAGGMNVIESLRVKLHMTATSFRRVVVNTAPHALAGLALNASQVKSVEEGLVTKKKIVASLVDSCASTSSWNQSFFAFD